MASLTGMRNFVLIFTIALTIPAITHLYITFLYPHESASMPEDIIQLRNKINSLNQKEQLDDAAWKQGKIERKEVEKIQHEIQDLKDQLNQKEDPFYKKERERSEKHTTIVFFIVMAIALFAILLGIFLPYPLLNTAFTMGGLFLVIYNFLYNWFSITSLVKLISMSIWFVLLIALIVNYYGKDSQRQ